MPPLDYYLVYTHFYKLGLWYRYVESFYHSVLVLTGNDIGPRDEL